MNLEETAATPSVEKRRKLGFFLIAAGAFLCVFGFLVTLLLLDQGVNFNVAMYGTTGAGGIMLLGGLVAVLG